MQENQCVRNAARAAGVPLWKVALAIGISEPTLMRWLRVPLAPKRENRIMEVISVLAKEVSQ